jgi:hypothetical protein
VLLRLKGNNLVTVLFGPSYDIRDRHGLRLPFALLSPGDEVSTRATPDPQRALYYTAFGLTDSSIEHVTNRKAILTAVSPDQSFANATIGNKSVTITLDKQMQILRYDGSAGTADDLVGNQAVELTGIFNRRSLTMLQTSTLRVLTAPTPQIVVDVTEQHIVSGQKQTVTIAAPANSPVSVVVRFAGGLVRRKLLPTDGLGRATYSFTVPLAANSATSQLASVVVSSGAGLATNTFTVVRARVELYLASAGVKAGRVQTADIIGPPDAWVTLQFLYADGHYEQYATRLSPLGRGTYSLTVPSASTAGSQVTVQAILTLTRGTYLAVSHFRVR